MWWQRWDGKDWDKLIPYILFAYREVPQESTGFFPFELLYGRDMHERYPRCAEGDLGNESQERCEYFVSCVDNEGPIGDDNRVGGEELG